MSSNEEYPGRGWRKLTCGCILRYRGTGPMNGDIVLCPHADHNHGSRVTPWRKADEEVVRESGVS